MDVRHGIFLCVLPLLVQAAETRALLTKSRIGKDYLDSTLVVDSDHKALTFNLVRYVKNKSHAFGKTTFVPIDYPLTEEYSRNLNSFINNPDKGIDRIIGMEKEYCSFLNILHKKYACFFDIFYLEITENNRQKHLYKSFFLHFFNKIKGQKLHWDLSLIIQSCHYYNNNDYRENSINQWLNDFCPKKPVYYKTGEFLLEQKKLIPLFVQFDFNRVDFQKAFSEMIKNEIEFYTLHCDNYVTDSETFFLTHKNALIELFPLDLKVHNPAVLDFTLYPIEHARGWLYAALYNHCSDDGYINGLSQKIILAQYAKSESSICCGYGHQIKDVISVYKTIKHIIIDYAHADFTDIQVRHLIRLFPNIEKITLINQKKTVRKFVLNATDAYALLRNTINYFPHPSVVTQGTNNNIQVSYRNMIKSIFMHCLIPTEYDDRSVERLKNVFFIANIVLYLFLLYDNIIKVPLKQKLLLSIPSIVFIYPFLLSKEKCIQMTWGKKLSRYVEDKQDLNYYVWRKLFNGAVTISWLLLKISPFKQNWHEQDMLFIATSLEFVAGLLAGILEIGRVCWYSKSLTPYILGTK